MANRPRAATPGSPTRLVVQGLVSLGLVVAIFYFLLQGIDLAEVEAEIGAMTGIEGAILAAITAWNLATYALVELAVKPGLGFWRAIVLTQAATAVSNTVPSVGPAIGVGLTYRMLGSWAIRGPGPRWRCWSRGCGTPWSSWAYRCWPWSPCRAPPLGRG